jgi:hypothetical protein
MCPIENSNTEIRNTGDSSQTPSNMKYSNGKIAIGIGIIPRGLNK